MASDPCCDWFGSRVLFSILVHCKKVAASAIDLDLLEESKITQSLDAATPARLKLRSLQNRFTMVKLEEAHFLLSQGDQLKDENSISPTKRKLVIRSNPTVKSELPSPFLSSPVRDQKALADQGKIKVEKKIIINHDWKRDLREYSTARDQIQRNFSVDLDYSSPPKNQKAPLRSKSFNNQETSSDAYNSLNCSQVYADPKLKHKSPIRMTSVRQEPEAKFSLPRPRRIQPRPIQEFSIDT